MNKTFWKIEFKERVKFDKVFKMREEMHKQDLSVVNLN